MEHSSPVMDQASGLRRMQKPQPVRVIAVASGKGGVGKTNVSINLSVALAAMGQQVMLLDADLGLVDGVAGDARGHVRHDLRPAPAAAGRPRLRVLGKG